MRTTLALSLSVLLSCSTAGPATRAGGAFASPAYASAVAESRAAVTPLLEIYPGITAAAAVNGEMVWSEGFGFADVETQKRAAPDTVFRLYSTSKSIAAALAMRMAERNQVDLDAPASRYLPDLPVHLAPVTLRQLLGHRGGVRHYRPGEWMTVSSTRCATAKEALAPFISDPLVAAPGQKFNYSSFGYVLASAILEAAGKKAFYDLLEEEILAPAGIRRSGAEHEIAPSLLARGYGRDTSGALQPAPPSDSSCKFGAGGLAGTAEDLARFGVAVAEGRLISRQSVSAMFVPLETDPGRPGYGLGFVIEKDAQLGEVATHSGGALGGRSFLLIAPRQRVVVALAGNLEGTPNLHDAAVALARAFAASQTPR